MQSPADDGGGGFDEHRRAAPAVPSDEDNAASRSAKSKGNQSPGSNVADGSLQRGGKLDEDLFSADARRQYVALKELEGSTTLTKVQYDRIHHIRWATRHLAIADLAETLLRDKRPFGPISTNTRREIAALIQQCERHEREQLLKTLREDPAVELPRAAFARWLVSAALAGFVLGGGLAYLLAPKGAAPDSRPAEAYIDTRTGEVVAVDADSENDRERQGDVSNYQPAYYCWKCRQWLPVRNPQKHAPSPAGPMQTLSDRPVVPPGRTR